MKPERALNPAGRAALHSEVLLRPLVAVGDVTELFETFGKRFGLALADALIPLCNDKKPEVQLKPARALKLADLQSAIAPRAANWAFRLGYAGPAFLVSVDGQTILRLVDQVFGGTGSLLRHLPEKFPASANILIEQIQAAVSAAMNQSLISDRARPNIIHERLSDRVDSSWLPASDDPVLLECVVAGSLQEPWEMLLCAPKEELLKILGSANAASSPPIPADPGSAPFADIELPLRAVLVDMMLPISALARLDPGTTFPVTVPGTVPLIAEESLIARGAIGTEDGRLALKITQIA